ncbi:starvation-inducible transcriptional regulator [Morganella phage vB_Mm5]
MQTFKEVAQGGKKKSDDSIDKLICKCLGLVYHFHCAHFMATSYHEHVIYEEFYTGIGELGDKLAETYIGITESFKPVTIQETTFDALLLIDSLIFAVDSVYDNSDSSLQSIMDEIKTLCYTTRYKLTKFNK